MAISTNATGAQKYQANGASYSQSSVITVAAGSNTVLLVVLIRADVANDVTAGVSATWNGVAMTQLISGGLTNKNAIIFGLRNPATGNNTLAFSWTNTAADNFIDAIAYDGVDVTNNGTAFPHTATVSGVGTLAVTSATGNKVVGAIVGNSNVATLGTTLLYDNTHGSVVNASAETDNGAASVTVGMVSGNANGICGVDVAAAAGGGGRTAIVIPGPHGPMVI